MSGQTEDAAYQKERADKAEAELEKYLFRYAVLREKRNNLKSFCKHNQLKNKPKFVN